MRKRWLKNMKSLIDANVILRYLLADHPQMSEQSKQIIERGAFTVPEVLAEVVYVLKGVYEISRIEIADTLIGFLEEIHMKDKEVMRFSLQLFAETSLDFVDCILIARHRKLGDNVISFDKKLNKMLDMN